LPIKLDDRIFLSFYVFIRIALIGYSTIAVIGQLIFCVAIMERNFYFALLGRTLYGIGAEALTSMVYWDFNNLKIVVCMSTIGAWCFHKISFGLGVFTACGRLGSVASNLLLPYFYHKTNSTSTGFFIGFGVSIIMMLSCVIIVLIEKYSIKHDLFKDLSPRRKVQVTLWEEIKELQLVFWVLCILCGLFESAKNCFYYIGSALTQIRFNFSMTDAGILIVFFQLFSLISHSQFPYLCSLFLILSSVLF